MISINKNMTHDIFLLNVVFFFFDKMRGYYHFYLKNFKYSNLKVLNERIIIYTFYYLSCIVFILLLSRFQYHFIYLKFKYL